LGVIGAKQVPLGFVVSVELPVIARDFIFPVVVERPADATDQLVILALVNLAAAAEVNVEALRGEGLVGVGELRRSKHRLNLGSRLRAEERIVEPERVVEESRLAFL